ncbi:MAG: CHAD domain-containing protein, partial [Thermoleophilaceae bacterium]
MAYRLEAAETLPDGLRRIVREQLDDAIEGLRAATGPDAPSAVHNARKDIKKTRSVLRLVREQIGEELYRHENDRLREIASSLSGARDAEVLVETLGKVQKGAAGRVSEEAIARLRLRLEADRDKLIPAGRGGAAATREAAGAMREVADALQTVREGIEAWPLTGEGFDAIEPGLRRIYTRGRERMAEATEDPTVLHLHEWRKRAKDLWYHSRILEPVWPGAMKAQIDAADELGELLGEDHDLAILHRRAGDHGDALGSAEDLVALLGTIAQRRLELSTRAFSLGRLLYAESPKAFVARIATAWDLWRDEPAEPAPPMAGNGASDGLTGIDLHVAPHEASDLLPIDSRAILDAHGWDIGFWAVLDDVRVERSLVAIGHREEAVAIAEGWEV